MKLLFLFLLVAATVAAAPIRAHFRCDYADSRFVASGGLNADIGGDYFCENVTTPTRLSLGVGKGSAYGYINDYVLAYPFLPGDISSFQAIFDLDPLGDSAAGYFSVRRVVTVLPLGTGFTSEEVFRLDVVGTYTRLPSTPLSPGTNISFLFNADTPETGTAALMILGLTAVAVWRRYARPRQVGSL